MPTPPRVLSVAAAALLGLAVLAGCSAGSGAAGGSDTTRGASAPGRATPAVTGDVTVLAAASLTETVGALADEFEADHPGTTVTVSYGGSSALAQQIVAGSPVDVFLSASSTTMSTVADAGLVEGDPAVFARNALEIAVPVGDPGDVASLADLATPGVTVALCAAEVPCGALARQVLDAAGLDVQPATLEPDVKSVLTKVELGEVDAGLVYETDVRAAGDRVEGVAIDDDSAPTTAYLGARLRDAPAPAAGDAFLAFVLSPAGQQALADAGFRVG